LEKGADVTGVESRPRCLFLDDREQFGLAIGDVDRETLRGFGSPDFHRQILSTGKQAHDLAIDLVDGGAQPMDTESDHQADEGVEI
jgi:hypothetical protein